MERQRTVLGKIIYSIMSISISESFVYFLIVLLLRGSTAQQEVYAKIILSIAWMIVAWLEKPKRMLEVFSSWYVYTPILYVLLLTIVNQFISDNIVTALGGSLAHIPFFIGIYIAAYYRREIEKLSRLAGFFIVMYVYFCIKATIFYVSHPEAARDFSVYQNTVTIGSGYGLAFGAAVVAAYLTGLLMTRGSFGGWISSRVVLAITLIASILLCYYTRSTITLFAMIIGMSFNLFFARGSNSFKGQKLVSFFIIVLIITIMYIFRDSIAVWMIRTRAENRNALTDRLAIIGRYILYDQSSHAVTGRVNTYFEAIKSFVNNPLFGASFRLEYTSLPRIGNHSTILDAFGWYGFVIGSLNSVIYFFYFKILCFARKNAAFGSVIVLIIIAFLNPITQSTSGAIIFMFIPLVDELITASQKEK